MSMLAERKHKQKWCLNPRGNLWVEDKNKFGKRIMEKMGWKDGKGLGPNENGLIEHVKVSYKNDSKGMGFKENGEQWTEHEDKFTTLLKSLDPNNGASNEKPEISGVSLEEKSQKSRSRVHYHKFTRGKDLTRYSEKDLANIFGKKSLTPAPQKPEPTDEKPETSEENTTGNKFGVETVERGSMVDYFKQKFPHFSMRASYEVGANGVLKSTKPESESETDEKCGFGFSQTEKPLKTSFVSYVSATESAEIQNSDGEKKKKKKKRKNAETAEENPASSNKKMKLESSSEDFGAGFVNPAFDPLSRSKIVGIKHSLTTIAEENVEEEEDSREQAPPETEAVEETPKLRKKNTKQKLAQIIERREEENNSCFTNETLESAAALEEELDASAIPNPHEVKRKTKKKKQTTYSQEEASYSNSAMEENDSGSNQTETVVDVSELYEVKRKSKKCKKKFKDVDEDVDSERTRKNKKDDSCEDKPDVSKDDDSVSKDKKSKKKKLKKSKSEESGLDNPALNLSAEENGVDNPSMNLSQESEESSGNSSANSSSFAEKKTKKRKKNALSGLDNPALDLNSTQETNEETSAGEAEKKSKKRKKNALSGLDNPALDLNSTQETNEETSAGESEKNSKKSKKNNFGASGLDNPGLTLNLSQELNSDADVTKENVSDANLSVDFPTPESSATRKKSVRFSEVHEERIIPNALLHPGNGLDNAGFDLVNNVVAEGVENLNNALDNFQSELENDMNEKKQKFQELQRRQRQNLPMQEDQSKFRQPKIEFKIEDPCEEDAEHGVVLKYAESNLKKFTMRYRSDNTTAKKTYKHLIKGDILVQFKGTNFHSIEGYAVKKPEEKRKQ